MRPRAPNRHLRRKQTDGSIVGSFLDVEVVPSIGRLYASVAPATVKARDDEPYGIASYTLPGLMARFITATSGKIYVTCAPKSVVMIDPHTSSMTTITFDNETGNTSVFGGSLYVMTGYPFRAGTQPNADGAYGIVEVVDAATGAKQTSFYSGLQSDGMAIHASSAKMYIANTGDSYVDVVDLTTHARSKRIDSATSIEDIIVRPSDGALVVRNPRGGNSLSSSMEGAWQRSVSGNWPTRPCSNEDQYSPYAQPSRKQGVGFDIETLGSISSVSLGVARLRSMAFRRWRSIHRLENSMWPCQSSVRSLPWISRPSVPRLL